MSEWAMIDQRDAFRTERDQLAEKCAELRSYLEADRAAHVRVQLTIIDERDAAQRDLVELRTTLAQDGMIADAPGAEPRASAFWYASWREGNRRRAEMLVEMERLRSEVAALKAQVETRYQDGRL